jgi:hypothetical protein
MIRIMLTFYLYVCVHSVCRLYMYVCIVFVDCICCFNIHEFVSIYILLLIFMWMYDLCEILKLIKGTCYDFYRCILYSDRN